MGVPCPLSCDCLLNQHIDILISCEWTRYQGCFSSQLQAIFHKGGFNGNYGNPPLDPPLLNAGECLGLIN
jgi:hypothetical protein